MNRPGKEAAGHEKRSRKPNPSSRRGNGVPAARTTVADVQGARVPAACTRTIAGQAVDVPGNCAPSIGASPVGGWWSSPAASFSHDASPSEGLYPPGGFTNYLQSNPENFHFVGATMSWPSMSPNDPCSEGTPSPAASNLVHDVDAQGKETIDIDVDDTLQEVRTDKRLSWSRQEDVRLASAWLHNSKDPVDGNGRKADQYWADVTKTYNSTTESYRMRNRNQLKIRWERVKKPLSDFHGCWVKTTRVWQSGVSDDQLMDKAIEMYAGQNNDKPFTLQHIWKVVRHDMKWSAYLNRLNKEKDNSAKFNPAQVVNLENDGEKRPMGHKRAKNERNGKRKAPDALSAFSEKLEKFIEASTMARTDREKMSEVQQSLADKKIEAAKLNHKAAHEQTKCKMLDTYKEMMLAPTGQLTVEALAERDKALESMRLFLFAKDD